MEFARLLTSFRKPEMWKKEEERFWILRTGVQDQTRQL